MASRIPVRSVQPLPTFLRPVGFILRKLGQTVDKFGLGLQGRDGYLEHLVPNTKTVSLKTGSPRLAKQNFIAPSASIVGQVQLHELSSVWYGASIRGDTQKVTLGRNTAVLDQATVEASGDRETRVGDDVIIGPGARVSSSVVEDGAMIGAGAKVTQAHVSKDAFVDAGAVVPPNTVIKAGQLWTGNPAKYLRDLTVDEMAFLRTSALINGQLGSRHASENAKTVEEIQYDLYLKDWREWMGLEPEESLPELDAAMVQYYTLSMAQPNHEDQGMFRKQDFDDAEMLQRKIAEEAEADRYEEEYYSTLASLERVHTAVRRLTATRSDRTAERERILREVDERDEKAAAFLQDLLSRAASVEKDSAEEQQLLNDLIELDPETDPRARGLDAEYQFTALVEHAKQMQIASGTDDNKKLPK